MVKDIPDIFTLEEKLNKFNLEQYHGWEKQSIANLLNSINTGILSTIERNEAQAKPESLGAKLSSNVSTNTNYVIVGKNPEAKYKKAMELDTKILSEEEWCKILSR